MSIWDYRGACWLAALVTALITGACRQGPETLPSEDGGTPEASVDGAVVDAGAADAGVVDAGAADASAADAGAADAGAADAGVVDAGAVDAGAVDAGADDAGVVDAGVVDAGVADAGVADAGLVDAGLTCTSTSECSGGTICKASSCEVCVDTTDDALCGSGRLCVAGACVTGDCRANVDCSGGKVCKANSCATCLDPSDDGLCGTGKLCLSGTCVTGECRTSVACTGGKVCKTNTCVACITATDDKLCPSGAVCSGGACVATPLGGETCGSALALTSGAAPLRGTTANYANDFSPAVGCGSSTGPDAVYSIAVGAGEQVTATVAPLDAVFNPALSLIAGPASACVATPRVCAASDDTGTQSTTNTVRLVNDTTAARTYFVVVDSSAPSGGAFEVSAASVTAQAGEVCGGAETLPTTGTPLSGTTAGYFNDYSGGTGCASSAGPERVYAVAVPPSTRVSVSVTPTDTVFNPSLSLVSGPTASCAAPRVCVASDDTGAQSTVNQVAATNETGATATYFAIVDSASSTGGPFTVSASVTAPVTGEVCAVAEALTQGTYPSLTTVGFLNDYAGGVGCPFSAGGPERVFSIDVPPGQRVIASVTSTQSGFNPSLSLVLDPAANCSAVPRVCVASDASTATSKVTRFSNLSSSPQRVFVIVDSTASGTSSGTFSMTLGIDTPPPLPDGETCANATALALTAAPLMLSDTLVGYAKDVGVSTGCMTSSGPEHAYAVTIPVGKTLRATVAPSGFDVVVNFVTGPAASCLASGTTCVAGADSGFSGDAELLVFANTGSSPVTGFVLVSSYSSTTFGAYTLTATVTP